MFEKLLELILGAKAGALSGVLIVAGALVTVASGNGVTTVTVEHPSRSPAVETSAEAQPSPLERAEPSKPPEEREGEKLPATSPAPVSCADEAQARSEARQKVQAAFAKHHAALEQLRGEHASARAAETLKRADAMLREIAEKADRILSEMGLCRGEARVTVVAATHVDADPATMQQVAERAVAAMETVYNLAKSAAEAMPAKRTEAVRKPEVRKKPAAERRPQATRHSEPPKHDEDDD